MKAPDGPALTSNAVGSYRRDGVCAAAKTSHDNSYANGAHRVTDSAEAFFPADPGSSRGSPATLAFFGLSCALLSREAGDQ
jgi:hypothetical protein